MNLVVAPVGGVPEAPGQELVHDAIGLREALSWWGSGVSVVLLTGTVNGVLEEDCRMAAAEWHVAVECLT